MMQHPATKGIWFAGAMPLRRGTGTRFAKKGDTVGKQGCCADKSCNPKTCMDLPDGKICGVCYHFIRCSTIYGHKDSDTYCDWFPRRFLEAK